MLAAMPGERRPTAALLHGLAPKMTGLPRAGDATGVQRGTKTMAQLSTACPNVMQWHVQLISA